MAMPHTAGRVGGFSGTGGRRSDCLACSDFDTLSLQQVGAQASIERAHSGYAGNMQLHIADIDALRSSKQTLLTERGLKLQVDCSSCSDVNTLLEVARIVCLDETEAYFAEEGQSFQQPLNPRNEAAALSLLLETLTSAKGEEGVQLVLQQLTQQCDAYSSAARAQPSHEPGQTTTFSEATPEARLASWAESQGICGELIPAAVAGGLRGAAAVRDIRPGGCAAAVPAVALLSQTVALASDLGQALQHVPGLTGEDATLLWTMVERTDPDSACAPFWAALPTHFNTGLSLPDDDVERLRGSPAHAEVIAAREHIQQEYERLHPVIDMLLTAYPGLLTPSQLSWASYLWAVELWYAYALQVQSPDASVQACLVPLVSLLNHSPCPHIVRYGRLDPTDNMLRFPTFRTCAAGEQCFLSYGALPNLKLLLFYGMALTDNPHDTYQISLELSEDEFTKQRQAVLDQYTLTLDHQLRVGPIPGRLLATLRIVMASNSELEAMAKGQNPLKGPLSPDNEADVMSTLASVISGLIEALPAGDSLVKGDMVDVYLRGQHAILEHCLAQSSKLQHTR